MEVLRRIDSTILSDEMKEKVVGILNSVRTEHKHSYSAQVKIVCHYFMQLMAFNQDITAAEQHIRNFQEKCNNYLISNQIIYNSQDFTCQLLNRVDDQFDAENSIRFQNLSSGEKQIVSLFSHLYLDKDRNYANFKMQNIFEIVGNQLQPRYGDVDSLLRELFRESQVPYVQVDIALYIDLLNSKHTLMSIFGVNTF